jgi:stage V sporulation protein B
MGNSKKSGFIMQAGILAAAGIIVRLIGILYRSPLVAIIGDEGNGYYNTAYTIYTIILLISSYSIPSAISKVIAARLAKREYRNAQRIFNCSFIYVSITGGIGSVMCFFGAEFFVGQNSATVLKVFAPTIFLSGLLGVFRGYFQAHRTMLQTSFSQIVEQILNAIVSLLAAYLLMGLVADKDATTQAIYGAVGSALGTGSGVLIALIFMWLIYLLNKPSIQKRIQRDKTEAVLGYGEIFKIIILMVTPVVLSTFIYNVNTASNLKFYQEIMQIFKGYSEVEATTNYGLYSGKAMQIINIPVAIASSMSAAIIPTIARTYEMHARQETNIKIAQAIKVTMLISIPSAVGLFVLAKPVVLLLYPQKATVDIVASLIRCMAVAVVFYGLSTLTNAVLQGTGKVNKPVTHALCALVMQTLILVPLLLYTNLDLYALCIATVIYALLMCLLNALSIRKHLNYEQELFKTFVLPAIAAFWMGVVAGAVYFGLDKGIVLLAEMSQFWRNIICLIPSLLIAVIVYFMLVIKLGAVSKNELKTMPKGRVLVRIAEKLHLVHR